MIIAVDGNEKEWCIYIFINLLSCILMKTDSSPLTITNLPPSACLLSRNMNILTSPLTLAVFLVGLLLVWNCMFVFAVNGGGGVETWYIELYVISSTVGNFNLSDLTLLEKAVFDQPYHSLYCYMDCLI